MKRLRDKFKKYRSRSKELTSSDDVQRMKAKYGRKRPVNAAVQPAADLPVEPLVKVHRVRVSSIYTDSLRFMCCIMCSLSFVCEKKRAIYSTS